MALSEGGGAKNYFKNSAIHLTDFQGPSLANYVGYCETSLFILVLKARKFSYFPCLDIQMQKYITHSNLIQLYVQYQLSRADIFILPLSSLKCSIWHGISFTIIFENNKPYPINVGPYFVPFLGVDKNQNIYKDINCL